MKRLRFLLLAVPLAVLAAPVLAACLSCCPPAQESPAFGTRMPCCSEDCGTVLVAGVRDPALKASWSYAKSELAVVGFSIPMGAPELIGSEEFSPFLASSPPLLIRPLLSLRI